MRRSIKQPTSIEKPVIGYIVVTCALLAGMIAATALGQTGSKPRITPAPVAPKIVPREGEARIVPHRRWILGVRADATDSGYLVRSVEFDSAASRIGLEPGDRIVAIDGQQIGFLGSRLIKLSSTLEAKGGRTGRVLLLVQDRRNMRLVTLKAQLRTPLEHLGH